MAVVALAGGRRSDRSRLSGASRGIRCRSPRGFTISRRRPTRRRPFLALRSPRPCRRAPRFQS